MNAVPEIQTKPSRIHPLVAAAAVSIILACGTGVAATTSFSPAWAREAVRAAANAVNNRTFFMQCPYRKSVVIDDGINTCASDVLLLA